MNTLVIHGSPRPDGTSSAAATALALKLRKPGNEISAYNLNELELHGCQECFACRDRNEDRCFVADGLSDVLEQAKTADILIVASPVFYADISAQLKCFIDRTWSYFGKGGLSAEHLPRNRKMVFILSYGYDDPSVYDHLFEKYKIYFTMFGFDECFFVKARGGEGRSPQIVNGKEVDEQLEFIAAKLNG
jgi:multimeric flavodoxin WrbA